MFEEGNLKIFEKEEVIFKQGDYSSEFYVLLRGSVSLILNKEEYGHLPIIICTIYDGKEFGEVNRYEVSDNLSLEMVN